MATQQIKIELLVDDKGTATLANFAGNASASMDSVKKSGQSMGEAFADTWQGMAAGAASAVYLFNQVIGYAEKLASPFIKGFEAVEAYNLSIASMAAMVVTFSERQKGVSLADQWQDALSYATAIVPVLENIAAKTLLSGQETTALANAFARSGVFLRENNEAQIEGFTRISNALPLMTAGQDIMKQINTEIRSVMTGANEQSSMMLQTLKGLDLDLKSHLETWRAEGTVLEHIGDLLIGFGPATTLLEDQWKAVKSTMETTVTQVLRGGMQAGYREIIDLAQNMDAFLQEHKQTIQQGLTVAWSLVSNAVGAIGGVLSGFGPMLTEAAGLTGAIAYGWGGVMAALKPIGEFLGNSIALTYELSKMIGNSAVAIGALALGQFEVARIAWDEAKKNFGEVEVLSQKNRDILTDNIMDSIAKYGMQTEAAIAGAKKSYDGSKEFIAKKTEDAKEADAAITASAKLRYDTEKDLAGDFYKTAKDAIKTQEELLKAAGLSEADIAAQTVNMKLEYIGDYYYREKELIELSAASRSADDQKKLSNAEYIAGKLKALDSDVALKQKELSNDMLVAEAKTAAEVEKIRIKAAEDDEKRREKSLAEYQKMLTEESDFASTENERAVNKIISQENAKLNALVDLWDSGAITFEQYEQLRVRVVENSLQAQLERETTNAKQVADINYNAIKDIQGYEEIAYNMRLAQIDAQAAAYLKDGGDRVAIGRWVSEETIKAYIDMGKKSDDFTTGATAGFFEIQRATTQWGTVGYNTVMTFARDAQRQLDDNLFNFLTGRWGKMKFDFGSIMEDMLRILTNKIAEMIVQWGMYQAAVAAAGLLGVSVPGGFTNPFAAATSAGTSAAVNAGITAATGGGTSAATGGTSLLSELAAGAPQTAAQTGASAGAAAIGGTIAAAGTALSILSAAYMVDKYLFGGSLGLTGDSGYQGFNEFLATPESAADAIVALAKSTPLTAQQISGIQWPEGMTGATAANVPGYTGAAGENLITFGPDGSIYSVWTGKQLYGPPPNYLKQFAMGTDYVPYDMIAQIHKGERIVPADENTMRPSDKASAQPIYVNAHVNIDRKEILNVVVQGIRSGDDDLLRFLRKAVT